MNRPRFPMLISSLALVQLTLAGCCLLRKTDCDDCALQHCSAVATSIQYPDVEICETNPESETLPPFDVEGAPPSEFWELSLQEAIQIALQNGKVLRDLGARVLTAPETVSTIYDPAIREADPLFGTEGALSAFDAQLSTSLFWQKNDRVFNNEIQGRGVNEFQQDLATFQSELSKVAATGTRFSIRNLTQYDANNAENNLFPNASWETQLEAGVRQPLLQGAGVAFNRIAGPNAQPGFNFSTGVLVARINTDISLADFEAGVINFLSEVEDAYWELYFAYREFDAAVLARDYARETWQQVKARYDRNLRGGEAFKEARARAQLYMFEEQVQDALNGAPTQARSIGIYKGERRLRILLGGSTMDGRLIRPIDEPPMARYAFDWYESLSDALVRRIELRKQMWQIKRRELELTAARNFTLPRLDAVANWRLRGFGDSLDGTGMAGRTGDQLRFRSALIDFGEGDHQEWEAGLQLNVPIGFRQGWAAVRKAELQLARERAILREQERQVVLDLGDAVAESKRAFAAVRTGYNRLDAAEGDQMATSAAYDTDQATVELLLESQQRLAEARSRYFRSLADYAKSLKEVHRQKGTLLPYNSVFLNEGPWPNKACRDAEELCRRMAPMPLSGLTRIKPGAISLGPYPQGMRQQEPSHIQTEATESEIIDDEDASPSDVRLDTTPERLPEADLLSRA